MDKHIEEQQEIDHYRRYLMKVGTAAAIAAQSLPLAAETLTASEPAFQSIVDQQGQYNAFKSLIGKWSNKGLPNCGYNTIALPYPKAKFAYRLLINQYQEDLIFNNIEEGIANRGFPKDQLVTAIEYHQNIEQTKAVDSPVSGEAGGKGMGIHHEVGKFLFFTNGLNADLDIARIAVVAHGNSVLALGKTNKLDGTPEIKNFSGFPDAGGRDINSPSMAPYKHFHLHPVNGIFDPLHPSDYLTSINQDVNIAKTTAFTFDSRTKGGGVRNIPYLTKEAKATEMQSVFYLQELAELDELGQPKLRLQYIQLVMLEFFKSGDGEQLVRWPHISVNTLEKVVDTEQSWTVDE